MKLSKHCLKAFSFSVATVALATAPAFASVTPIYAGGGTLAFSRLKALGECASGILLSGNPSVDPKDKADTAQDPNCTSPGSNGYDYLFIGVGSGAGQDALLKETSPTVAPGGNGGPSESNTPYDDVNNGFTYFNSSTSTYGFPSWIFTDSDAPMDSLSNLGDGNTFLQDYSALTSGNGTGTGTIQQARGLPWQLPDAATDIGLVYSTTNLTFQNTSSNDPTLAAEGLAQEADLSVDMICYIWTKETSNGSVPSGSYDWSNSIFVAQYEHVGTREIQITYGSGVTPTNGSQPLQPVHRLDDSGSSYLFTLWLSQNCANYNGAGYTAPATSASTFPSFVIPATATGTGGEINTTVATAGGVGYSGPNNVAPAAPTGPTAAFLFSLVSKVSSPQTVYPSSTTNPNPGIVAAFTKVAPPVAVTNRNTGLTGTSTAAWGASLNKAFFRSKTSGAYPITGLTYIMGYQCYSQDTGNDNYDGVLDYVQFLTANAQAPKILAQGGLVSLDFDPTKNSQGNTMLQAEYNVLSTDTETALVGILASTVYPNPTNPSHPYSGPKACRDYRLDPNRT